MDEEPTVDSPRTRRRNARYDELISAAAVMFAKKGYRDTTIQEIAQELDMTSAAIYYYADSKEKLLYEIWQRAGAKLQNGIDDEIRQGGTAVEQLRRVFRRHVQVILADKPIFEVLILQRSKLPEFGRENLIRDEQLYVASWINLIREIPESELRIDEPALLALGAIAMLNSVIRWYKPDKRLTPEEIADIYFDMFTRGALAS